MTDKPKTASGETPEGVSQGSNNLVVACRNEDWEYIKRLIQELDTPQPLVVLEVLIADLTADDLRILGSNLRNPAIISPKNVNFQSAQLSPTTLTTVNGIPTSLQADLLQESTNANPPPTTITTITDLQAGSSFLSMSDPSGSTFSIWQLLQQFTSARILSHPHVISTNNKKAVINIKQERLIADEASGTTGGTTTATQKWIPAELKLEITPRISAANTVNLNVLININSFEEAPEGSNPNSGNRLDRNVTTNANVPSGAVLCLGGLSRLDATNNLNELPWIGRIPIIGWFFKNRYGEMERTSLTVFITPSIVDPKLRGGAGNYTRDQVEFAKENIKEGMLFDSLRDPITRWFFNESRKDSRGDLDKFVSKDELISRDIEKRGTLAEVAVVAQAPEPPLSPKVIILPSNKPIMAQASPPAAPIEDKRTNQLKGLLQNI